jgi:V8-like Glu-specific endopeptidase
MPSICRSAAAVTLAALLAVSATACGSSDSSAGSPASSASAAGSNDLKLPTSLPTSAEDLDKWKQALEDGGWKNWDKDKWLRGAADFINPIIKGLWDPKRMGEADQSDKRVPTDFAGDAGRIDPEPARAQAKAVQPPYSTNAPHVGKLFFDGPQGSMVCSATLVRDPAHPGRSNLVWTAGHCLHAGAKGDWYRNIAFVPSYNDGGLSLAS